MSAPPDAGGAWRRALEAAAIIAIAPSELGGLVLRAAPGPVRDAWIEALAMFAAERPMMRMPASIDDSRLLGGIDLTATLTAGRPIAARGLLAQADGGIVVVAMAERLRPDTAAHLAAVLDAGRVRTEREGLTLHEPARITVVALDEGIEEERVLPTLVDRLAIVLDITGIAPRDIVAPDANEWRAYVDAARASFSSVAIDDAVAAAFCSAAVALGIDSMRVPIHAMRVARALAALGNRHTVDEEDARAAAALVLAPRAIRMPRDEQSDDTPQDEPPTPDAEQSALDDAKPLDDVVLDAAKAALPPGLLAKLAAGEMAGQRAGSRGKAGSRAAGARHGRRVGSRAGFPRGGARLDLVATLRAAAPWQRLRGAAKGRIAIRLDDIRIARFEERARTMTLFLVDASGSAARERLAEAKGAVRLMLADCYIRRDEVALMAFRNTGAELLLPPTRSLVRAERVLASMAGGGGTPLATGLDVAAQLVRAEAVKGHTPTLVLMSDGRANVARDGLGGRPRAHQDALDAAGVWRAGGWASAFIDTSAAPGTQAREIAAAMGARYLHLPFADARTVDAAVAAARRP